MLMRIFVSIAVLVAIVIGILAIVLRPEQLVQLFQYRDFFNVTLPVLAFAALIKYLCSCNHHKCGHCNKEMNRPGM